MKRLLTCIAFFGALSTVAAEAHAAGYPWTDHRAPYDFLFGNELDTHQQTRLTQPAQLTGFLYVHYTGAVTSDGLPVARHGDCRVVTCDVGWILRGQPAAAVFLYHVEGDHPIWLVDRRDIPQPGAFVHFHWLGAAPSSQGDARQGYLLELQAVSTFCFTHDEGPDAGTCEDRGGIAVRAGIDVATHVNIVASFP